MTPVILVRVLGCDNGGVEANTRTVSPRSRSEHRASAARTTIAAEERQKGGAVNVWARTSRTVWAHLLTTRGLLLGEIAVPGTASLLAHLNRPGALIRVTPVGGGGWWQPARGGIFLRKDAVALIVPSVDERVAPAPARGRGEAHPVAVHLSAGSVSGELDLRPGTSPADFVGGPDRFFVLERCKVRIPALKPLRLRDARVVIVNARALVALVER